MGSDLSPRLAVRAVIMQEDKLLLVNAWPGKRSDLWCAPGGGVERGASLPANLTREVHEETGLTVQPGPPCLVNEFHDPESGFHQVEIFFRCKLLAGTLDPNWRDPEAVVNRRRWVTREECEALNLKPSSLPGIAWARGFCYDPLEPIQR
ncbi:MAG: NUDIX domain-containing protein [Pseudomonadota bacterium]